MSEVPPQLLEDDIDPAEMLARIGRFAVLKEMGFFGEETNIDLAKKQGKGSWTAQVRKRFSGTYGDTKGCHPADIESAAEMLGVFDQIYDVEWAADEP